MFEPSAEPRVFALPPGADFPRALIDGLANRLAGHPPEAWARVTLIVNTRRMARRLRDLFDTGPPRLLPRIRLVTDLDDGLSDLPRPAPPLRRRLELAQLVARLIETEPDLAPRTALFDLADSLAGLMGEMAGEGVAPDTIAGLDVSDLSGHWARAQRFIAIAAAFADPARAPDVEARQRMLVEDLCASWAAKPPTDPIIVAGSTGSRGATQMLMRAVSRLPQGALVLPGFDFDLPSAVWSQLDDALTAEDHPQFRFKVLLDALDLAPSETPRWVEAAPPSADRNRVLSLALRPAPVTDAWLSEGPALPELGQAMSGVTLLEAPDPRTEALAIALRLRQAVEDGQSAALITPDRMLTRQVQAALDRWSIIADDSAGQPLHLAPPGRFLRQISDCMANDMTPDALLALLKHPLCHSGQGRGEHLLHTRDLELWMRRQGGPHPDADMVQAFAKSTRKAPPQAWLDWVCGNFLSLCDPRDHPLATHLDQLVSIAETAAAGSETSGDGALWEQNAGLVARDVIAELRANADAGGPMRAADFSALLTKQLQAETVRDRDKPHPLVMIWGTLEARVQGADMLILGGLNEGSWPEAARPDPWLNRQLRLQAGLMLPERRIGLAAHDFQQAAATGSVWLTRSKRTDDAESVPSRWLNRLTNLLGGLPNNGGPAALTDMRARGAKWLGWAAALDAAERRAPAPRPSPRPPVATRPTRLSVTQIKTLIRDPYAIYARHVLGLRPLDPLVPAPDALLRGIVVHEALEVFTRDIAEAPSHLTTDKLLEIADQYLARAVPWAAERRLWRARLARVADWFIAGEERRRADGTQMAWEASGRVEMPDLPFVLTAKADRIDRVGDSWAIFDYKTGTPPSKKEQKAFDKQLLLEAAMLTQGAFDGLAADPVSNAVFIGLGGGGKEVEAPLVETPVSQIWEEFRELLLAYKDPAQGYTARRMLQKDSHAGDYDHLARFGEWDAATDPTPEDLT